MDDFTLLESLDTDQLQAIRDAAAHRLQCAHLAEFVRYSVADQVSQIDFILQERSLCRV